MDPILKAKLETYKEFKLMKLNEYYTKLQESLGTNKKEKFVELNSEFISKTREVSLPGKNLRGLLVILGYELSGKTATDEIYNASLLIEMFHSGVLIHDDIMDNDNLRRGVETVHKHFENYCAKHLLNDAKHYGMSMGINAGDLNILYGLSIFLSTNLPAENVIEALKIYSFYTTRVVLGQTLDITNYGHKINESYVEQIHKYKTAEYTGVLPLLMGAKLGGIKDESILKAIKVYGNSLGWAFQIKDDILGTFGNMDQQGKSNNSDILEGKNTILFSLALKNLQEDKKKLLLSLYGDRDIREDGIKTVRNLFVESEALKQAESLGQNYVNLAVEQVDRITHLADTKNLLISLVKYIMYRVS